MLIMLVWAPCSFLPACGWSGDRLGRCCRDRAGWSLCHGSSCRAPHPALYGSGVRRHFNVDQALESFVRGGWLGRGPGEGTVKRILPEAHTDFVFRGRRRGVRPSCSAWSCCPCTRSCVARACAEPSNDDDPFGASRWPARAPVRSAIAINMAVNLHLIPAKGMTLPFISYWRLFDDLACLRRAGSRRNRRAVFRSICTSW